MSGVAIIRALLIADTEVTDLVPATRIIAGVVPQGTPLPNISVSSVSGRELDTVARLSPRVTVRERVQVTVHAASYVQQKAIIRAGRLGPGTHRGVATGFDVKAIQPDVVGPDLNGGEDDGIYEQSRDFMVTFAEAS